MISRLQLTLTVLTAALTIAVAALIWANASTDRTETTSSSEFAGAIRPSSLPLVDFKLKSQNDQTIDMKKLRGRTVVVTFLYTTCKDECPTVAQQIRGALDQLGKELPVIAVSVDPKNDTPERARRFILRQHMTGRMQFGIDSKTKLEKVWSSFGIAPQTESSEHSTHVVLVDSSGRQRIGFPLDKLTPQALAQDIALLEKEQKE